MTEIRRAAAAWRAWGAAGVLAVVILLMSAPTAAACVLGTPSDWTFKDGVSVAFVGKVVAARDEPELVFPRVEITLEVEDVIAGDPASRVTIGPAGFYCQTLVYEIGDVVVVAGGAPADGSFAYDEFAPGPPYNKYNVAVWGPFNRPVEDIGPTLGGEPVGSDLAELVARLEALPDTAMLGGGSPATAIGSVLVVAAAMAAATGLVRRFGRRPRKDAQPILTVRRPVTANLQRQSRSPGRMVCHRWRALACSWRR